MQEYTTELKVLRVLFDEFKRQKGLLNNQLKLEDVVRLRKQFFKEVIANRWPSIENLDKNVIDEFFENQVNKERVVGATDYNVTNWLDNTAHYDFRIYRKYLESIRDTNGDEQAENIDSSTYSLLNKCHDPSDKDSWGNGRRGLVYGQVQSGKTANYIGLLARALDSGYKIVIVLSGLYEDLRVQTQERIKKDLFANLDNSSVNFGTTPEYGKGDVNSSTKGFAKQQLISTAAYSDNKLVFVVKKQKSVLENIILMISEFLEERKETQLDFPVLIIDDEADHGSIRSMTKKQYQAWLDGLSPTTKESSDDDSLIGDDATQAITALNRNIRALLSLLRRVTFVQYTATPYSVLMQTSLSKPFPEYRVGNYKIPISENNDLFPEHFCVVIEPGSKYLGLEDFFGNKSEIYPNRICNVSTLDSDSIVNFSRVTSSLERALYDFISAALVLRVEEEKLKSPCKFISMLIHPSVKTDIIETTGTAVKEWIKIVRIKLGNADATVLEKLRKSLSSYKHNISSEQPQYELKISRLQEIESLSDSELSNQTLEKVFSSGSTNEYPLFEVVSYHSVKKNQTDTQLARKLNYESNNSKDVRTYIVVGGLGLSRGLTLKGLVTSYLVRISSQMDTLSQMARWYGYRIGMEHLVRLYINSQALDYYKTLCEFDRAQRDLFSEANANDQCPGQLEFSFCVNQPASISRNWKKLRPASGNKMRSAVKSRRKIYGSFDINNYFIDETRVNENGDAFINFFKKIDRFKIDLAEKKQFEKLLKRRFAKKYKQNRKTPNLSNSKYFKNVPFEIVYDLVLTMNIPVTTNYTEDQTPFVKTILNDLKNQIDRSDFQLNNWSVELDISNHQNERMLGEMSYPVRDIKMTNFSDSQDEIYNVRVAFEQHNFLFDVLDESNLDKTKLEMRDHSARPAICFRLNGYDNIIVSEGKNTPSISNRQSPVILFGIRLPKVEGMKSPESFTRYKNN